VGRLTDRFEAPRKEPWRVTDAPEGFIENLLSAIVGLEMPIARISGKWKMSQNRPDVDLAGIVDGLREGSDQDREAVADQVEKRNQR
jgi:transcriptional regulator